jgi:ATP-binding cassette subfamily B protein
VRTPTTSRVAYRLLRNEPIPYALSWLQWVAFHLAPVPIGWVLKLVLDRLGDPDAGSPWAMLAVLAGFELGRWALLVTAAVQWHGAYVGWVTVPRVNLLRSLLTGPGPAEGRLPSSPGEAVSRFRDDTQDLGLVLDVWLDVSGAVAAAAIALGLMAAVEPLAALGVAAPVGVAVAASWVLGPWLRRWRRSAREATAGVTGFIGDTFGAVLAVKAGAAEDAVGRRFEQLNADRARVSLRDQVGSEIVRSLGYGTGEVAVGFVLLLVASSFRRGDLTVGDLAMFASYSAVVAGLPRWIGRLGAYTRQADVSVDRLAELLPGADRGAVVAPVRTHLRHGPPALETQVGSVEPLEELRVEDLTVRRSRSGHGLTGVDLLVRQGELVVVTGPVGSGKSTLLRALLGLVPRDGGRILWNGHEVADPATFLVPPRIAYLPQVPRLFSESLAATVLLGLPEHDLDEALWLACLDEDLARMPDGPGTVIGPRGLRLSGGQIQRTGAARALVRRPELLVVDDLSSALDVETEALLWERLAANGLRTSLLVSHRPSVLERADRVVVLDHGRRVSG